MVTRDCDKLFVLCCIIGNASALNIINEGIHDAHSASNTIKEGKLLTRGNRSALNTIK